MTAEPIDLDADLNSAEIQRPKAMAQIWRQYKTMLRKDFLVTLRHPVLLVVEILVPAILFLTICDDRFGQPPMTSHYDANNYSLFDLSKRSLAYYPSGNAATVSWIRALETMYGRELTSDELVGFSSEDEFKDFILHKCADCFWASFSFYEINASQLYFNYTWRINGQFFGDQETGLGSERLYDFLIAENMAEYATLKYLAKHPDVKVVRNSDITDFTMEVQMRKFPD